MMEPKRHRITRRRKESRVPLSNLRTSEVVRTVVDHPRRLAELINMLEDKDRTVRGRGAAILARLSESHAERLVRVIERLKAGLEDDSAYVRWSLAYTLGRVGARFPTRARQFLGALSARVDDENRIVRVLACRALGRIAIRRPQMIKEFFAGNKREIPSSVARSLRNGAKLNRKTGKR